MSRRSEARSARRRRPTLSGLALLLVPVLLAPEPALGHAALVETGAVRAVRVQGRFATGEPMADAQVTVFAPGSAAEPWRQGRTDRDGAYLFVPDDRPGRWSVRVRQAGHGAIAHLDLAAGAVPLLALPGAGAAAPTPVQKGVMAAAVIWGCIGTALYFRRRRAA